MSSTNTKKNFTLYPLVWISVCFTVGILFASFLPISLQIYLAVCLIFATLCIILLRQKFVLIFLSIAFISAGGLHFQISNQIISPNRLKILYDSNQINSGYPIEIEGVLQNNPEQAVGGFFVLIKSEKAVYKEKDFVVSGKIRLFATVRDEQIAAEYAQKDLQYGSRIRVACNLKREDNFLNPGVASRKEILDQKEIDATGTIKSPLLIEKISDEENFSPLTWLYQYRQELIDDFRRNFNSNTSGVLIASLLGNRYFLNKQTAEVFREGGTFHVLVISGLHITFIGGLTLLFVQIFTKKRFWQFLLASSFLWIYAIAVGAETPVIRASLMFTILLFSQVIHRRGNLLNALGACVLILLVWRPEDVFNQSFQLTITSVTAIIAMAFPLIENFRAIGSWSPSVEKPFPPNVSHRLKRFCETIYWREEVWQRDVKRQIWTAKIFKSPYLKWFHEKGLQNILRYTFEGFVVSFVVQIWLLPLLVVYFHRLSFFSVFLNLWVGINVALESFAALWGLLFSQISTALGLPFIKLTELLNWFLLSIPQFLIDNNWASARLPVYSGNMKAIYLLYFIPLLALTFLLSNWKPFDLDFKSQISDFSLFRRSNLITAFIFSSIALFSLIVFHPFSSPLSDGRLHIDFLDVGQGDSALITFPNGETMLIDGGGKLNFSKTYLKNENSDEPELFEPDSQTIGESVVSEYLWEKGYSEVDYILATHADADHIQGLTDIAKNFEVKTAIFGRTPFDNEEFAELFSMLERRNIESIALIRGDVLNFDDVKIEILYPEINDSPEDVSDNNNSLVLRLIYGNRKFLFTGDIEKETENTLVQNTALQADVVKVAHHGSRTSSTQEFINSTKAIYAIIPVGKDSRFGHPHEEVLKRWQDSGAKTLTTGERGTISISTDGKDLKIKTYFQ